MIRTILIAVLTILCLAVSAFGAPRLAAESPVYDFGTLLQGKKVEHRFKLENRGDQPLKIYRVETTCGCTVARDYPREIPPGKSGTLLVVFDSRHKSGPQSKGITLRTNSEPNARYVLQLKGRVLEPMTVAPRMCNFGIVSRGERARRTLTLTNHSEQPVHLELVQSSHSPFKVDLADPTVPAGGKTQLTVTISGGSDQPGMAGLVLIRTDLPGVPVITIRILARYEAVNRATGAEEGVRP